MPEIRYAAMTSMLTSAAEAGANNVAWLHEQPQNYVTEVRRRLAAGLGITAAEYLTVQRARQRIATAVRAAFEEVDAIVAPTTARVAPPIPEGPRRSGVVTFGSGYAQSNRLDFDQGLDRDAELALRGHRTDDRFDGRDERAPAGHLGVARVDGEGTHPGDDVDGAGLGHRGAHGRHRRRPERGRGVGDPR